MVRRSPSERYIRYLLVCDEQYTNEQIKELLIQLDLLYVSLAYINRLREQCTPGFKLEVRNASRHRPTREFLLKLEILDMFVIDDRSKKLLDYTHHILEHPRQKELVEALLNNNASHGHIATFIRFSDPVFHGITKDAIHRYEKLFWDKSLVDSREMVELCELRHLQMPTGLTVEERDNFIKVGNRNKYRDPRYISSTLPQNEITALVTQIRMGFPAEVKELKKVYDAIHQASLAAAYETLGKNMPMMGPELQSLLSAAKLARDMGETVQQAEESLRKQIIDLALRHDTDKVKTLLQLTAGNHSTDPSAEQRGLPESLGGKEEEEDADE